MKIIVMGATGKVGIALVRLIQQNKRLKLYKSFSRPEKNTFDGADVVIDFSHASCFQKNLEQCQKDHVRFVSGTTNLSNHDFKSMEEAAKNIPILYSTNFSIGIALITQFLEEAKSELQKGVIDILETHDISKNDIPSGTSLSIASLFQEKNICLNTPRARKESDLVISSLRRKGSKGSHDLFIDFEEESLQISHVCHSRDSYAKGALLSAEYLLSKKSGLYDFLSIFKKSPVNDYSCHLPINPSTHC